MNEVLKDCPYCGYPGQKIKIDYFDGMIPVIRIKCPCTAEITAPVYENDYNKLAGIESAKAEAIRRWNRRAGESEEEVEDE